ncbi:hypothetical protein DAPPUDRAFT_105814 [Daphnia pulex]|uniref:Uncharacterized protein n=1 Tax=Daphnia pulex TaxID=6669 RepID=E9GRV8_DAPPU|nr:hypothetical protein DAPPUDRAFT_105814 [Daphnia pulex]|eukprot:EFX77851.1 hypothetical protein DAPPUDRAFT_105814 [Daphnia pulex]
MFASGKTLWEALAAIRSTPVSNNLPSPSVLLQGRHLRGNLPFLPGRLTPQHVPATFVQAQLQPLRVGQSVRVLISGLWLPGTIESVCTVPDSYVVRLADGRVFRRTRRGINIDNSSSASSTARAVAAGPIHSSSASSTARAVAAGPILPKLVWHPPLTQPIRPEVPLIIPARAAEPSLPNPTTGPNRRGRPSKTTPPTPSQQPVIPPEEVVIRPGSTRSGCPYMKS